MQTSYHSQLSYPVLICTNMTQVGPKSSRLTCPSCKYIIHTKVTTESSIRTHLVALGMCLLGCVCCFFVPYFMDSCQNINHYCPNCGVYIGTYKS